MRFSGNFCTFLVQADSNKFEIVITGLFVLLIVVMIIILIVFKGKKKRNGDENEENKLTTNV